MPDEENNAQDAAQKDVHRVAREDAPAAEGRGAGVGGEDAPSSSNDELASVLESILFVSDKPLSTETLKGVLGHEHAGGIRAALKGLQDRFGAHRGIHLVEVAGGWQFRSAPENAQWVKNLVKIRPVRLSQAMLEVLAIIAYRQPVTRAGIEEVRGVDCAGPLHGLLDRRLIKIIGKSEEPGRPMLYGTTKTFLETFDLKDLKDLPTLKEFQQLSAQESAQLHWLKPPQAPEMAEGGGEEGLME